MFPSGQVDEIIVRHAVDPGAEIPGRSEAVQVLVSPEEGFLGQVLCQGRVAAEHQGIVVDCLEMPVEQSGERPAIAPGGFFHQPLIRILGLCHNSLCPINDRTALNVTAGK
jgi:hypothetical protein